MHIIYYGKKHITIYGIHLSRSLSEIHLVILKITKPLYYMDLFVYLINYAIINAIINGEQLEALIRETKVEKG